MGGVMSIVSIVFNGTSVDGLTISHWQATSLVLKNGTVGFGTESACVYGNHGNGLEQGYIIWKSSFPIRIVYAWLHSAVSHIGGCLNIPRYTKLCLTNGCFALVIPRLQVVMWILIRQEGIIDNGTAVCRTARTVV